MTAATVPYTSFGVLAYACLSGLSLIEVVQTSDATNLDLESFISHPFSVNVVTFPLLEAAIPGAKNSRLGGKREVPILHIANLILCRYCNEVPISPTALVSGGGPVSD